MVLAVEDSVVFPGETIFSVLHRELTTSKASSPGGCAKFWHQTLRGGHWPGGFNYPSPVLCWLLYQDLPHHRHYNSPGERILASPREHFLLSHASPWPDVRCAWCFLKSSRPPCYDGALPRLGTNSHRVTAYPRSVSSPRIADPSIKHWASVVKGNFFCKGNK